MRLRTTGFLKISCHVIYDKEIHGETVEGVQFLRDEWSLHDHPLRNFVVPTRSVW